MCVLLCSHTSVVSFQVVRKMAQLARRWIIGLSTFLKSSILPPRNSTGTGLRVPVDSPSGKGDGGRGEGYRGELEEEFVVEEKL